MISLIFVPNFKFFGDFFQSFKEDKIELLLLMILYMEIYKRKYILFTVKNLLFALKCTSCQVVHWLVVINLLLLIN